MNANPILLQKKYVRIVELFAEKMGISVETALGIFYHSQLYQLISEGISDMHCMSDGYLAEELERFLIITGMSRLLFDNLAKAYRKKAA